MSAPRRVIVEADGGSRGNPGPAAYGALVKDADTGELIAERGETIGTATNNVAEYRGLIAGLELAAEHAPDADVEVWMDSKLVVEQMSGRWKIKHPDMVPLATRANALAPFGTTYAWMPRERNKHADRLANEALDGIRDADGLIGAVAESEPEPETTQEPERAERADVAEKPKQTFGWAKPGAEPTTLILVRHGVTAHTSRKLFSGGLGGANPPLTDEGRDQARSAGAWLAPMAEAIDAAVTSPVRRTRETAEILVESLGLAADSLVEEAGIAEMEFGEWDGKTFLEIHEERPDDLAAWLGDMSVAPGGHGESFTTVQERVLAARDRLVSAYAGKTVLAVSHVTPIKVLVADAVGAPLNAVYRMELAPASVTVISYFLGGPHGDEPMANLRLFNARPTDAPLT